MSQIIFKYPLQARPVQDVMMPMGATLLHVAEQHGAVCLWAVVDLGAPCGPRRFHLVGTGFPPPEHGRYIGTVLQHGGQFVWHVFEEAPHP